MIRRTLLLARILGALLAGFAVLAGLAAWRLASGPITLTALTPYLTPPLDAALASAGALHSTVGETTLSWGGLEAPLVLRLTDVQIATLDGQTVASVPSLAVELSLRALLRGRLALAEVIVERPTLHLERTPDGRLELDVDGVGKENHRPAPVPVPIPVPVPSTGSGPSLTEALADRLHRAPEALGPLGTLTLVAVADAGITIDDRITGISWSIPTASLSARRQADGLRVRVHLDLRQPGGIAGLEGKAFAPAPPTGDRPGPDADTTLSVRLQGLEPETLGWVFPNLPLLSGIHLSLDSQLDARFDRALRPQSLTLTVTSAEGGFVELPSLRPEPVEVASLALTAGLEPASGRLVLEHTRLELASPALTLTATGTVGQFPAAPSGKLHLELSGTSDPQTEPARLDADLISTGTGSDAGRSVTLRLSGLEPARLAGLAPALAPLSVAALPVGGTVGVELDRDWQPLRLALDLASGPGQLVLPPALLPDPVPIRRLALNAVIDRPLDPVPARLDLKSLAADFGGPRLAFDGTVTRAGDRLALVANVKAEAVPAAELPRLWPPQVGKNARAWITANIKAGMIDQAWLHVDGSAPVADPGAVLATALEGGVAASDLTVSYFKTLPPVTGISGRGTSDGRSFVLQTTGGHLAELAVNDAKIVISKLDTPQEWIDIDAPLSGPLRSALEVLDTPPLRYAHRVDIDPTTTEGTAICRLHFYFPLKKSIDIENVDIHADATLHQAAVQGIAGGLAVGDGELKLGLDGDGMDVSGTARLAGLPASLQWRENFNDSANLRTLVKVQGRITDADLTRRGLPPAPYLSGSVGASAQLVIDRTKKASLAGSLDLAQAGLALPPLGWSKAQGLPGSARFTVGFEKNHPAGLSDITVEANGLTAEGLAELTPAGALAHGVLRSLRVGVNDLSADLRVHADGGTEITLEGAALDARPLLKGPGDEQARRKRQAERQAERARPPEPGPPTRIALRLDRLVTGDKQELTHVAGRLADNGAGWDRAELAAGIGGSKATVSLSYLPEGDLRRLTLTSDDAGALAQAFDLTDSLRGGALSLSATGAPGFPRQPVTGHLTLGAYRVVDAPLLARILNALSVTGLMELLQGQGLGFSQLDSDLTWGEDEIKLANLRTSGSALGLTLAGKVDLTGQTLDLQGTIVPAYGLNRILGIVPVLGDLLSGGAGQGVFAATYYLSGPIEEPKVRVNPLAALAPGFLRNLFFLNPDAGQPAAP